MFRIHFQVKGAYWCIQFSVFHGLFWRTVRVIQAPSHDETGNERPATEPDKVERDLRFNTYEDALAYADERGLSRAYKMQDTQSYIYASPNVNADELLRRVHDIINRDNNEVAVVRSLRGARS